MSIATEVRPIFWDDVVGQESVITILTQQIKTKSFKNAYIFSGASGCGKTTVARIFARGINGGKGNPIELDAASNNGVDDVRTLIGSASERSLDSEYKVVIIDECHMFSNSAWNAMLKTIEEPPKYTIFIFCTTDPQKIPQTIQNRCMRFNFTRIPSHLIEKRLNEVCEKYHFINYEESTNFISRICNGEMRNALSLLETASSYNNNLDIANVISAIGSFSYDTYFDCINNIIDGNVSNTMDIIDSIYESGTDLRLFINRFIDFCLDVSKYTLCGEIGATKLPQSMEDKLKYTVGFDNASEYFFYIIDKLLELKNMLKNDDEVKLTISVVMTQMCRLK